MGSVSRWDPDRNSEHPAAPWFVAVLKSGDHRFDFVNDSHRTIFGARDYQGNRARDVFPELEAQPFFGILDGVLAGGKPTRRRCVAMSVRLDGDDAPTLIRVDLDYAPITGRRGQVVGVFCAGMLDVSDVIGAVTRRAVDRGLTALEDFEVLALVLHNQNRDPRSLDVARALVARFGGVGGVMAASAHNVGRALTEEALADRLPIETARHLKLMRELGRRVLRELVTARPVLSSSRLVRAYLKTQLAHAGLEEFHVIFLDRGNRLIADEVLAIGTVSSVAIHPRTVLSRALELSAASILLVHNHPGGSAKPSFADRALTVDIQRAARVMEIDVHDHLIVAGDTVVSMRAEGLMG